MQSLSFYWPFIRLGATDVWRHKTRSFLTMLGMVFGVGSVIAMLAVGEGAPPAQEETASCLSSYSYRAVIIPQSRALCGGKSKSAEIR